MKLHDYQKVAVEHLTRNPRAALFLDMGLGKTAVTLRSLTPLHLPALVIAPKRVAENVWETETKIWRPDLTIAIASGSVSQRGKALNSGADIVVIGRDNIRDVLPFAARFKTIVLDEMSGFKNRSSMRWKVAKKLAPRATYVWGLTGTPAPNGLIDLWSQIYLLDGGERLGSALTHYRARYFSAGRQLANGVIIDWHLRPEAEENIHKLLSDICLSMDSDEYLDLPPVTFNQVVVPMAPSTRKVYNEMRDTLVSSLETFGGEVHTAANAAVLSSKLRQISAGFMYVDDNDLREESAYDIIHTDKVKALGEIIESAAGSPLLVFYSFKAEKDMITAAFPNLVHTLDEKNWKTKWDNGEIPILLAHPASAGHGLNLQHGGHTIVWCSLPWSLEEWEQGNKRVARQGQQYPVVIHMLMSPDSVDEAIRARLQDKTTVQDALLAHLQSVL
jgi:SNF2 family DNA or RNA helicase